MAQWRVPVKLAKRVAELVYPLVISTPKSLEFPQRLFSPICAWKGKTYRQRVLGARAIIRDCRLSHKRPKVRNPRKITSLSFLRSFSNKSPKIPKATVLNDFCNINHILYYFHCLLKVSGEDHKYQKQLMGIGETNESKGNKSVVLLVDLSLAMTARPGVPQFFSCKPIFHFL